MGLSRSSFFVFVAATLGGASVSLAGEAGSTGGPRPSDAELAARGMREGFHLTGKIIDTLQSGIKSGKGKPVRGKIMLVGGTLASSRAMRDALKKGIRPGTDFQFTTNYRTARKKMRVSTISKGIARALASERPEAVLICVGKSDAMRGLPASKFREELSGIVDEVLRHGAMPILMTFPMKREFDRTSEGVMKLYIDGRMASTGTSVGDVQPGGDPLYIGCAAEAEYYFGGCIDEVRVYDRALSEREIKLLASPLSFKAKPTHPINTGLAGWWRFDERKGNSSKDSSGNGKDASFVEGPKWVPGCNSPGALKFDGEKSYAEVGGFRMPEMALTVSCWVKHPGDKWIDEECFIARKSSFALGPAEPDQVCAWVYNTEYRSTKPVKSPDPAEWHHYAVTYEDSSAQGAARKRMLTLLDSYNKAVRALSREKHVPVVAGWRVTCWTPELRKTSFDAKGGLTKDGLGRIAKAFAGLHGILEGQCLGRGTRVAGSTGGDAAGTGPAPVGNLVRNGGFEERDEETRFAMHWSKGQWGARGAKYSVRLDASNPREGGEKAVVARALDDGAMAGARTSLKLDAGTYRVSYWACAHVGKSATVGAQLAGSGLPEDTVGDEWTKFSREVEVKTRTPSGSLSIWTSTKNVRVWFDDVEVVMTAPATEEE